MKPYRGAFGMAALVLAGLTIIQVASGQPLPNAWQVFDNSGAGGSTLSYITNLMPAHQIAATNLGGGWRYTVHARFVDDFVDTETIAMAYGLGNRRFLIWFDFDNNGDLTARLDGGNTYTLTASGTGWALYHTHEIVFNPTNGTASYLVDGQVKTNNWPGSANALTAGQVSWGAGSSSGQGEMNFHTTSFEINGLGVVAAYDAGTAGSPTVAPEPTTQGWTQNPAVPAPGTIGRPVAADLIGVLPNAWQIMDNSTGVGSTLNYTTNLIVAQRMAATNLTGGFHYTVHARFVDDFSSGNESMAMAYSLGGKRFLVWWGLDGSSNLTARLDGGSTYPLTTNGAGSALYHTHEFIFNPTNSTASYVVDGVVKTNNWPGSAGSFAVGQVYWGAGSSPGQGQMNFHTATFEITGLGTVAAYNAGMVGAPPTAPNPIAQGWTLNYSALVGTNAISPDMSLLPVATTLVADQFTPDSAHLNGRVNASGSPAMAWFEWGTSLAYGNTTAPQPVGTGISAMGFSNSITSLIVGTNYHFRAVVSNAFGVVTGTNRTFNLDVLRPLAALTDAADLFTLTTARLNGRVNPNGSPAMAWFEWGTSTNYGNATLPQAAGAGVTNHPVTDGIGGLLIGTNYFFRVMVSNAFGVVAGNNQTFNLAVLRPLVTTQAADQLTNTTARLNGQVNSQGWPTTAWFEWGTDTNYGNTTALQNPGSGNANVAVAAMISGLVVGPIYHFRLVATNAFGMDAGTDQAFNLSLLLTTIPGLPGVCFSSVAWGDYDNDGRLDFLLTGNAGSTNVSQLWRNTGVGFSNVTASVAPGLPGVVYSSVAWGDYDNDGRLDFLLTGDAGSTHVSQLWRNTGVGFSNVTASVAPGLPGIYVGSVAWGDYNNDGRLDFLLTGDAGSTNVSQLWRNTGGGFSNVTASVAPGLPGVYYSSVAWGDYDNDGRLDFLLTGASSTGLVSQLWRNTGSGFSNVTASVAPGLPGVYFSSVAWGDYDNDGRLDFLLTGTTNGSGSGAISQLWRNMGSGFSNVTASVAPSLPRVFNSSVALGDYDNDGRLDFLFIGTTNTGNLDAISQLWRNTGSVFTKVTIPGLPDVDHCSVAWGDYDNDGRLDFLFTGHDRSGTPFSQLWRNNLPGSNAPPAAPAGLSAAQFGESMVLNWNAPTDDLTPAAGLNYNVRIGTMSKGVNILSSQTLTDGTRLVPQLGNAGPNSTAFIQSLPAGDYFWSVQAVDTSFAGSPFAADHSFSVRPVLKPVSSPVGAFRFQFVAQPGPLYMVFATTNVALPLSNWIPAGISPVSMGNNLFQVTDPLPPNRPQRFYLLRKQ